MSARDMAQRKGDVHEVFCAASCSSTAARHLVLGEIAMDGFRRLEEYSTIAELARMLLYGGLMSGSERVSAH